MGRHHHSIGQEATSAGAIGAAAVAAWFLLLDFVAGRPLHIVSAVGQVLLLGDTGDEPEVRTPDAWHAMARGRTAWWKGAR